MFQSISMPLNYW